MDSVSCIPVFIHIHVTVMSKENGVINWRTGSMGGGGGKQWVRKGEGGSICSN